jgi:tetratricopeptide (TPR) repeat protein
MPKHKDPSLQQLAPLLQAVAHGCRAGLHKSALNEVYWDRICRRSKTGTLRYYLSKRLGGVASELQLLFWFFDIPYVLPCSSLNDTERATILGDAAYHLRSIGQFEEAIQAELAAFNIAPTGRSEGKRAASFANLALMKLYTGNVADAVLTATRSLCEAVSFGRVDEIIDDLTILAECWIAAGCLSDAKNAFAAAERYQSGWQHKRPILYSLPGYRYCEMLIQEGNYREALARADKTITQGGKNYSFISNGSDHLTIARAKLGLALQNAAPKEITEFDTAIDLLHSSGVVEAIGPAYLARAAFRRYMGDWAGAHRDLDEVDDLVQLGKMKLLKCDALIECARLHLSKGTEYVPWRRSLVREVLDEQTMELVRPLLLQSNELAAECGYVRRNLEMTEIGAIVRREIQISDLPPSV